MTDPWVTPILSLKGDDELRCFQAIGDSLALYARNGGTLKHEARMQNAASTYVPIKEGSRIWIGSHARHIVDRNQAWNRR
jgi:hypothetical protein